MARSAALAKIHIACKDLGLAEEDYRAILRRVAGADSAAKLTPAAHEAILTEFQRLGWKPAFRQADGKRAEGSAKRSAKPGVRLIFGLWTECARRRIVQDGSRRALLAFVARQTGIAQPDWLTPEQVNIVVEGLKAMIARAKARARG